ncbi:MAG: SAM-dependent methyltransferase, partial [Bacillaceae bacterium]|nr:SAM-dependent methyltransferase [Bacillaceae bacterium]
LVDPQPGERCHDPAAGTFGFMVAAARHVREQTGQYSRLSDEEVKFQKYQAFSGVELVPDTHRLAVMNALLHDIHGEILLGDTLSPLGERLKNFDVILTNPPFGTKKGGERVKRNDFTFQTANKQLNFLQHVYRALKPDGKARAAVVVPDNVLFEEGIGADIRRELMEMCNLHTILRLPTGIFYAPGVKTNVLFFTRGEKDTGNTKEVWVYDLRTDMPSFGKRNPLTREHFTGFIRAYTAEDRRQVKDERWNVFTREEIAKNGDNLDIGLLSFAPLYNPEKLPDPIAKSEEAVEKLGMAISLINEVIAELKAAEQRGRR